jgi:hypothetical protein
MDKEWKPIARLRIGEFGWGKSIVSFDLNKEGFIMKLKNIVEASAEVLGFSEVGEGSSNFNILKRCANLVLGNISADYYDFVATQEFGYVRSGRIDLVEFEKPFLKVLRVTDGVRELDYSLYIGYIKVPVGRVQVEYAYSPSFEQGDDEVNIAGLGEQGFVYGVLAEYAFISGMANEAVVWNARFEEHLFRARKAKKRVNMPAGF